MKKVVERENIRKRRSRQQRDKAEAWVDSKRRRHQETNRVEGSRGRL